MKTCEYCDQAFEARRAHARFCSPQHRVYWNREHRDDPPTTPLSDPAPSPAGGVTRNPEEDDESELWATAGVLVEELLDRVEFWRDKYELSLGGVTHNPEELTPLAREISHSYACDVVALAEEAGVEPSRFTRLIADRDHWQGRYWSIKGLLSHDGHLREMEPELYDKPRPAGGTRAALDRIAELAFGVARRRPDAAAFVRRVRKADREGMAEWIEGMRASLDDLCAWLDEAKTELDTYIDP